MAEDIRFFPPHQLPPGFLKTLDSPASTRSPRHAATLALLRRSDAGLEVLLLKRSPGSGFIPGAYVFPGGRVDAEDASPGLMARMDGITPLEAQELLGISPFGPPAVAYWGAALRETFEETGVLLTSGENGAGPDSSEAAESTEDIRARLLAGEITLEEGLDALRARLDAGDMAYIGHWITPECEPRRYDTRFFAAQIPSGWSVRLNRAEMVEALWLTPSEALARNRAGTLPLVFPTVRTLEDLLPFGTPEEALAGLKDRPVPRRLPRVVKAHGKIGFAIDQ